MNHINFKNHLNTFHSVQSIEKDNYLNPFQIFLLGMITATIIFILLTILILWLCI